MRPNCITCNTRPSGKSSTGTALARSAACATAGRQHARTSSRRVAYPRRPQALRASPLSSPDSGDKATYLLVEELDLEVLGRLLRDPAAEIELVHLAVLVPHGGLVVHDELQLARMRRVVGHRLVRAVLAFGLFLLLQLRSDAIQGG